MPSAHTLPVSPRWYWIPLRILLVTFLITLLSFAFSLLAGILRLVITSRSQGIHPDMTAAYRHVALPLAVCTAVVAFIAVTLLEIRTYRQTKALAQIARSSQDAGSIRPATLR